MENVRKAAPATLYLDMEPLVIPKYHVLQAIPRLKAESLGFHIFPLTALDAGLVLLYLLPLQVHWMLYLSTSISNK